MSAGEARKSMQDAFLLSQANADLTKQDLDPADGVHFTLEILPQKKYSSAISIRHTLVLYTQVKGVAFFGL